MRLPALQAGNLQRKNLTNVRVTEVETASVTSRETLAHFGREEMTMIRVTTNDGRSFTWERDFGLFMARAFRKTGMLVRVDRHPTLVYV